MKTKSWTIKKLNKLDRIMGDILLADDEHLMANIDKADSGDKRYIMIPHRYFGKTGSGRKYIKEENLHAN